ncbi:uncharacterized protein N7459_008583 [Penicillium hispanicum]|uniref:uncharacterized protein n=1 Tax=Penicillium hispanicum TaxID=1080232 RepID=UPI002541E1CE|nr:uncharacterized protein N7459_008583 [Penicillium hispanicum]KAJ5574156.1 hypothetical protein N7459_008583 [Penicillium hispanicum]
MILETFTRVFIDAEQLEASLAFYKTLLNGEVTLRFPYPEKGLELAAVSSPKLSVLFVAGSAESRKPFEQTKLTIKVDQLDNYVGTLIAGGCEQLESVQDTPAGRKTRFRHPDGVVVEYVDHRSK